MHLFHRPGEVAGGRGKDLKTGVPITRIGGVTKCVEIESRAGSGPDRGIVTGLKNRVIWHVTENAHCMVHLSEGCEGLNLHDRERSSCMGFMN